jgi:hypothetical protein
MACCAEVVVVVWCGVAVWRCGGGRRRATVQVAFWTKKRLITSKSSGFENSQLSRKT